jgi:type II secretory pathway pseudopilin PulG
MMTYKTVLSFREKFMTRPIDIRQEKAFTLIELVIVLGITGLIFGGLWGLLTSGSAQLQAQSAAQQYRQVIDATRKFLNSTPNGFVVPNDDAIYDLPIAGAAGTPTLIGSGILNPNFATPCGANFCDAFGHQINVKYRGNDLSGAPPTPRGYIFMVYSTGSSPINDKAGSQVSSLIGADGGFIYSVPTEKCSDATNYTTRTCGSFGSFSFDTTGWTTAGLGHIATLSYSNENMLTDSLWLARTNILGDEFNTMSANLLFNDTGIIMGAGNAVGISLGSGSADTAAIYMAGPNISNLGALTGNVSTMTFQRLGITASDGSGISMTTTGGPINVTSARDIVLDMGDTFAVNILGNTNDVLLSINGKGVADEFQAGTFIYTSDATLKTEVTPISDALNKLMQVHGVNYKWKGLSRQSMGLLAQDVEKVFPEVVSKVAEGKKGVDYAKMVAPIIEAIRQLKEENDTLKARIKSLENAKQAVR